MAVAGTGMPSNRARAGAHLEHGLATLQLEKLRHAGHDPGLRDRLAVADPKRAVAVGPAAELLRDEQLPRHLQHGPEHALVVYPAAAQLALHHALALLSGCSSGVVRGHARSPCPGRG